MLSDADVLADCGVCDGATVHLVIKSAHHVSVPRRDCRLSLSFLHFFFLVHFIHVYILFFCDSNRVVSYALLCCKETSR